MMTPVIRSFSMNVILWKKKYWTSSRCLIKKDIQLPRLRLTIDQDAIVEIFLFYITLMLSTCHCDRGHKSRNWRSRSFSGFLGRETPQRTWRLRQEIQVATSLTSDHVNTGIVCLDNLSFFLLYQGVGPKNYPRCWYGIKNTTLTLSYHAGNTGKLEFVKNILDRTRELAREA